MKRQTYIDPTADVHEAAGIGEGTMVWNWTKVRGSAVIGEDCNIGQCVYIDTGVTLGNRCKVQNGVSIYQGVSIGNGVFVGPNVTFTNDRYPRAHSQDWEIVPTIIEDGVSIGANATIVCGVKLGQNCMIAAGAVVTRDVPSFALVMGQPARVVDYVTLAGKRLHHDISKPVPSDELLNSE